MTGPDDPGGPGDLFDNPGGDEKRGCVDGAADRRLRGRAALAAIHGPVGTGYADRLAESAPEMAELLLGFYADTYARPGLNARSRQIATIAALTVLGDCEHELRIHVASGLRAGLTRTEITEVILQMTGYAGFPRALTALKAAMAAFEGINPDPGPNQGT